MRPMSSVLRVATIVCYPEDEDVLQQRRQVNRDSPMNCWHQAVSDNVTQESLLLGFALLTGLRACLHPEWRSSPPRLNEAPTLQNARWERIVEKSGFHGGRMQRGVCQDHDDPSARLRGWCLGVLNRVSRNNPRMPHARIGDTSTTKRRVTLSKCLVHSVGGMSKQRGFLPHVARTSTSRGRQMVSLCSKYLISL